MMPQIACLSIPMALIGFACLSACASGMNKAACMGADWTAVGLQDGENGEPADKFKERDKRCGKYGVAADVVAYEAGRQRGVALYCTAARGFKEGSRGAPYRAVCTGDAERRFLADYALGEKLHDVTQVYNEAVGDYETAARAAASSRYDLERALTRYNENVLDDVERSNLRSDINHYRREIESVDAQLPSLARKVDEARMALDAVNEIVRREGY